MERCTQNFAETTIPVIPVCLDAAKLSLKSGLAEVNIERKPGDRQDVPHAATAIATNIKS
jgi:hypothetical protein